MVLDWMILKVWLNLRKPYNVNCKYNESVDESFEHAMHEVMSKKEEKNSILCTKQKKNKSRSTMVWLHVSSACGIP